MKRILSTLVLIIISSTLNYSQSADISPLQGKLLISVNGGITIPRTDFKEVEIGPIGTGSLEYFFSLKSKHALGLKLQGGAGTLEGSDERHPPYEFTDDIFLMGGGIVYSYAIDETFMPYIQLGIANIWYNPKGPQGTSIVTDKPESESLSKMNYNAELGLRVAISDRFSINFSGGEYIAPGDQLDGINAGKHNDVFLYGMFGVSVSFFGEEDSDGDGVFDEDDACPDTPAGVQVDLMGCPIDTDKDGVPDYLDKCSGTPVGIEVDKAGCPIDTDKDGIPDYLDNCPDSPAGISVDKAGCSKDSDNDGVPDYKDNCSDTQKGLHVDEYGCPDDLNQNGIPDKLESKEPAPEPKPEALKYNLDTEHLVRDMIFSDGNLYTAQISAWRTRAKAESEAAKLNREGYNTFVAQVYFEEWSETWYRVRVGYFKTFEEAAILAHQLR